MKRFCTYIFLTFLFAQVAQAQLVFPNGTTLNLLTHKDVLYIETEIKFYTGANLITDYQWERLPDSVNTTWDHQACMNGDCKVGLPASGGFITDFGINDTTGFIRFHVNSYGINGSTQLRYLVRNKNNFNDAVDLEFNITYTKNTGLAETSFKQLNLVPNPCSSFIYVSIEKSEWETIRVINATGQQMLVDMDAAGNLLTDTYPAGLYFVVTQNQRGSFVVSR